MSAAIFNRRQQFSKATKHNTSAGQILSSLTCGTNGLSRQMVSSAKRVIA
ncbi:hypothetical protein [Kolteria novifilia]